MDREPPPIKTVTCRYGGCWNYGIPRTLPCTDDVECGCCLHPITDIQPA